MSSSGRDEPGSASEKRSASQAMPFEGCGVWFEKMKEWFESRGGAMDCCEAMRGSRRAEPEAEEGDA